MADADEEPFPFVPPTISWAPGDEGPPFYDWKEVYPFLEPLLAARAMIWEEAQAANRWHDWPVRCQSQASFSLFARTTFFFASSPVW